MVKRHNFIKLIRLWTLVTFIILGIIVISINIYFSWNHFNHTAEMMRQEHIFQQKQRIKQEVNRVINMIKYETRSHNIKFKPHGQPSSYREKKIKKMLLERIGRVRFGGNRDNYIFVVSYDGTILMNDIRKDMIGKNQWNITDPNGVKIVQEERKAVENPLGGFIYYSWNKPGRQKLSPKVSFIRGIKESEWMVGAGVYLDDVESQISLMQSRLSNEIQTEIIYFILIITAIIISFLLLFNWLSHRLKKDFNLLLSFLKQAAYSDQSIDLKKIKFIEFELIANNTNMMQENIRQEQKKLEDSEQQLRNLFENSEVSIWNEDMSEVYNALAKLRLDGITNLQSYLKKNNNVPIDILQKIKILNVNESTLKLFDAKNKKDFLFQIEKTFGPNAINIFIDELCAIWNKAKKFRSEVTLKTLQGKEFKAIISFRIPKTEKEFKSIPVNIIDLSYIQQAKEALLKSETSLREAQHSAHIGSWELDLVKNKLSWSDEIYHIFNLEPQLFKATYEAFLENIHPDDRDFVNNAYTESVNSKIPYNIAHRLLLANGEIKFVNERCKTFYDGSGKAIRSIGTVQDITKQKLAEKEKKKLENQLAHSRKMDAIGQLAGGVAHDFNNMLAGIMGASDLLRMKKRKLNTKSLELVDIIIQSAERAASLTAKLLAFGRKSKISSLAMDLHSCLDDTLSILSSTIDKRIKISIIKEAHNHTVIGDTTALQNAIINMGINASHAISSKGEIKITTSNINLDKKYCAARGFNIQPGEYIEIAVRDTGCGISSENLNKIFEPFFTTKKQGKGTGLGLAAVYGTIQDHNGAITVYSEIGAGTVFHIYLPCSGEKISPEQNKIEFLSGSGHILLVDDEDIVRVTGKFMLEDMGYKVTVAQNGHEALGIFQKFHQEIDVVIMDMVMPEMNGRETFYMMKKIDKNCKIAIASGFTKDESLAELKQDGLVGFIQKPFRIHNLSKLLADILK